MFKVILQHQIFYFCFLQKPQWFPKTIHNIIMNFLPRQYVVKAPVNHFILFHIKFI